MRALCLVFTVEYSEGFLMIYVSLRSHNPVLTLWLLPGFASPPNIFFFVKFKRGNLSDGWRLDWCVCRKSVNNINFIWINKKVGSGKSHMAFFFSQVILSSTDKLFSNQSFELMTQSHLTVRAALCLIFLHEMRSVKDVPSNLSFWRFWETLFRLRAELWNAGSRAGLPTP